MKFTIESMNLSARLFGAFFYYPPTSEALKPLYTSLNEIETLFLWENKSLIQSQCKLIQKYLNDPELPYQYSILFEGQGFMPAPPWGSVYLDKENLLMGESTHRYREFLQQQHIVMQTGINEPEDQFGLMLMTLVLIIESAEFDAAKQLISQHIMPWAPRYLSLLKEYDGSPFYQALAIIVEQYLSTIVKTLDLTVPHYYLYK